MRTHNGFTLVEVLAALVILSMIVAALLPIHAQVHRQAAHRSQRDRAHEALRHWAMSDDRSLIDAGEWILRWEPLQPAGESDQADEAEQSLQADGSWSSVALVDPAGTTWARRLVWRTADADDESNDELTDSAAETDREATP